MTTRSSLGARRTYSSASSGRSRTGAVNDQPWALVTASRIRSRHDASIALRDHGASAPADRLLFRSGMRRFGSNSSLVPSPVHVGQAPCGELNEKLRGSSSSIVKPSYGQLYRSL